MKNLIYLLIFAMPFLPQAQESDGTAGELQLEGHYLFDITEKWDALTITGGWSVGNGIDESYSEYQYFGVLDFNNHDLEMMKSKLTVYGDTINMGEITLRFPLYGSDFEVISETLSIEDAENDRLDIKMYPNPADVNVTFTGEYVEKLTVYDLNGKVVYRGKPKSETFTIITSEWSSGMYMVQIWCDNQRGIFKKLIVK